MFRYVITLLVLFACCASFGCQKYTTGMQQSVSRADEASAILALRAISTTQRNFSISNDGNYGTFEQLVAAGLDERFKGDKPKVSGYVWTMNVTAKTQGAPEGSYSVNADPAGSGSQAGRHLYMDSSSGIIHINASQPATAGDPALGSEQ
jgi:hypothetical protein